MCPYFILQSIPYNLIVTLCEKEEWPISWLLVGQIITKKVKLEDGREVLTMAEEPGLYKKEEEKPEVAAEESPIYNEIINIEKRIEELKKAIKAEKPRPELTDDELQWLHVYRRAKELSPERLEILESLLKTLGLIPTEEKLWIRKRA